MFLKEGIGGHHAGEVHELVHGLQVQPSLDARILQDPLDLGGKNDPAVRQGVKEGADAGLVPDKEELFLLHVIEGDGELAVQFFREFLSQLLVQVEADLHVRLCGKNMALCHQLFPELSVIIDLSVAGHDNVPVFV